MSSYDVSSHVGLRLPTTLHETCWPSFMFLRDFIFLDGSGALLFTGILAVLDEQWPSFLGTCFLSGVELVGIFFYLLERRMVHLSDCAMV